MIVEKETYEREKELEEENPHWNIEELSIDWINENTDNPGNRMPSRVYRNKRRDEYL